MHMQVSRDFPPKPLRFLLVLSSSDVLCCKSSPAVICYLCGIITAAGLSLIEPKHAHLKPLPSDEHSQCVISSRPLLSFLFPSPLLQTSPSCCQRTHITPRIVFCAANPGFLFRLQVSQNFTVSISFASEKVFSSLHYMTTVMNAYNNNKQQQSSPSSDTICDYSRSHSQHHLVKHHMSCENLLPASVVY